MYAVCVTFQLNPGSLEAFRPLIERNASESLANEPGCQRFDICTDPSRRNEVFLYELYDDEAAFGAHRGSDHFLTFGKASESFIAGKTVSTYTNVRS